MSCFQTDKGKFKTYAQIIFLKMFFTSGIKVCFSDALKIYRLSAISVYTSGYWLP